MTENDVTPEAVRALKGARDRAPFGVIVAADRASLRSSKQAELVDKLASYDNIEWIGSNFDFDKLSASARRCRRRMLRISRRELESALDNGEIVLRYQPKVERNSGNEWLTQEAEALIRWHHPEHGLIGPLEFLPEAEAFGLMADLSEFVLREAAKQQVTWRNQGIVLNSCINLASSQLNIPDLASKYRDIVREAGLECAAFTFEVIEQDLTDPSAPHLAAIKALRNHGFRICLDDFRVAASSLGTFEHLPFDEIKIHASALQARSGRHGRHGGPRRRDRPGTQSRNVRLRRRRRGPADVRVPEDHRVRQDAGLSDLGSRHPVHHSPRLLLEGRRRRLRRLNRYQSPYFSTDTVHIGTSHLISACFQGAFCVSGDRERLERRNKRFAAFRTAAERQPSQVIQIIADLVGTKVFVPVVNNPPGIPAIYQRVERETKISPRAGPRPILWFLAESRSNRIHFNVAHGRQGVCFLHRQKTLLPSTSPILPAMSPSIASMKWQGIPTNPSSLRGTTSLDVIAHQAVCPDLDVRPVELLNRLA